jgi:superfamily II DNA or RNA helicase/transposase
MKLRDYELDWIKRINASKQRRILVVGPTGSGKTIVAAELIRRAIKQGGSILFIVHRRELLRQAVQRLFDHGVPWEDIGAIIGGKHAKADAETFEENPGAPVQVASIQTLVRRKMPKASYVFIDEAHHASAATYQKVLKHYPKAKVIGLTATPYRLDGKPLGDMFDEIVESAKPSELIKKGWIVRPQVWTVPPSERPNLKSVKRAGADLNQGDLEKVSNKKKLVGSIVKHWKKHAEGRPTVCYAVSIDHADVIAQAFNRARIKASVISSKTPVEERSSLLEKLKTGEVQVLVNCMVLTEGWDCPEVKCAIVARPTLSQSLWFQMGGRIMRPGGKPIILDHAGNALWMPCPGDDIEHSLTGVQKLKTGHREPKEKTCPKCGNQLFLGTRVCTDCGYEFWEGLMPEEIAGQLIDYRVFEKEICDFYVNKKMSAVAIAKKIGCSPTTAVRCLKRNGIKFRSVSETKMGFKLDERKVIDLYVNKKMLMRLIAKKVGCSNCAIIGCLKRNGIKIRSASETKLGFNLDERKVIDLYVNKKMSVKAIAKKFGCSSPTIIKRLKQNRIELRSASEVRLGFNLDERKVIDLYVNKKMSAEAIAKKFGCSSPTITKRLKQNRIELRSVSEEIMGFKLDERKVIDLYVNKKMSAEAIAKKFGCSNTAITNCLKRNDIK